MTDYEELHKLAKAAARRVSFQWPNNIGEDDLAQDILVRLLDSPGSLQRVFEEDEPTRRAFMVKVAHQVASDEHHDYERFSGNYTYDTSEVRGYLEEKLWLLDTDKFKAAKADLTEAIGNLASRNSNYYASLINRYQHDLKPDSNSAERKRLNRAVESVTEEMNLIGKRRRRGFIEGPGSRRVVSNGTAAGLTVLQNEQGFDGQRRAD